jgi:leucine-rich repeat kinase 2
MFSF